AQAYVRWLSQQTGKNYSLPSEAEWEYAARAGTTTPNFWDDKGRIEDYAWYSENSGGRTHAVGEKKPNTFGLYDTAGNVWEWTLDCWHDSYQNAPAHGLAWLESEKGDCVRRVVRGGSWFDLPQILPSANRFWDGTDEASNDLGFRVARAL
ncbi:MAG: formylglycine-generating enzyme family protein, partial [Methylococcales bacterium]